MSTAYVVRIVSVVACWTSPVSAESLYHWISQIGAVACRVTLMKILPLLESASEGDEMEEDANMAPPSPASVGAARPERVSTIVSAVGPSSKLFSGWSCRSATMLSGTSGSGLVSLFVTLILGALTVSSTTSKMRVPLSACDSPVMLVTASVPTFPLAAVKLPKVMAFART